MTAATDSGATVSLRALDSFEASEATTITTAIKAITSVQIALISGFTPSRTSEYIRIGSVAEPGPVVKLAITRSSSESVNASIQPAAIAGRPERQNGQPIRLAAWFCKA